MITVQHVKLNSVPPVQIPIFAWMSTLPLHGSGNSSIPPPRDTFTYSTVHEPATWTGSEVWRSDTSTRPGIKLSRKARQSMYRAFTVTGEWVQDLRGCAVDGWTLAPAADFVKCKWRSTRIWAFTVTRVGVELTWWKADELLATRLAPAL